MVIIKGTKDGLLITIGEGDWPELLSELVDKLERPGASEFFRGARARVDLGDRKLSDGELGDLTRLLEQHSMELDPTPPAPPPPPWPSRLRPSRSERSGAVFDRHEPEVMEEAALIHRTLRSGQAIRYPGNVVIIGDVNAGAEIVAGGDVIVWGKLRGVVHAGASGEERAIVAALALAPTQLRIGGYIARAPDDRARQENTPVKLPRLLKRGKRVTRYAEIARVRDGQIVVESWKED